MPGPSKRHVGYDVKNKDEDSDEEEDEEEIRLRKEEQRRTAERRAREKRSKDLHRQFFESRLQVAMEWEEEQRVNPSNNPLLLQADPEPVVEVHKRCPGCKVQILRKHFVNHIEYSHKCRVKSGLSIESLKKELKAEKERERYGNNQEREQARRQSYRNKNVDNINASNRQKYREDPEPRRVREKERYAANPDLKKERERERHAKNPDAKRTREQIRHAENPEVKRAREQTRHTENPEVKRSREQTRHAENPEVKRSREQTRHAENPEVKRSREQTRHAENPKVKRAREQTRHTENPEVKRSREQTRHAENPEIKRAREQKRHVENADAIRTRKKERHAENPEVKRAREQKRYAENPNIIKVRKQEKYANKQDHENSYEALLDFRSKSIHGPIFPCVYCNEFNFRKNVSIIELEEVESSNFIRHEYRLNHISDLRVLDSYWQCSNCKVQVAKGKVPKLSTVNMIPDETPSAFKDISDIENCLMAPLIVFMKIHNLKNHWRNTDKVVACPVSTDRVLQNLRQLPAGTTMATLVRSAEFGKKVYSGQVRPKLIADCIKFLLDKGYRHFGDQQESQYLMNAIGALRLQEQENDVVEDNDDEEEIPTDATRESDLIKWQQLSFRTKRQSSFHLLLGKNW